MTQWDPHVISHESLVSTDQAGSFWGEGTSPLPAPQPRRIQGQGLCPKHVLSISIPSTVTNLSSVQKDVQRTVSEGEKGSGKGAGDSPRLTRSGWGTGRIYFPSGNQGVMGPGCMQEASSWALPRDLTCHSGPWRKFQLGNHNDPPQSPQEAVSLGWAGDRGGRHTHNCSFVQAVLPPRSSRRE